MVNELMTILDAPPQNWAFESWVLTKRMVVDCCLVTNWVERKKVIAVVDVAAAGWQPFVVVVAVASYASVPTVVAAADIAVEDSNIRHYYNHHPRSLR